MILHRLLLAVLFSISVCGATTVNISFTGLPAVSENGTYNGFATATINGIPNQMLLCDDSEHRTYVPSENLIYDYSNLVAPNPLEYARFVATPGNPTSSELDKYEEAAVLLWELAAAGPSASADLVTDYQYAVWNLFNTSTNLFRANQTTLQQAAVNVVLGNSSAPAWLSTAYASTVIYTPTAAFASNQEFLALAPVPEPAMGWLLAFMGAAVGIGARIRRRRA